MYTAFKNLKCEKFCTQGLPKNLKSFAFKRQVKHTSFVVEPSIPVHKLVKFVDVGDIANSGGVLLIYTKGKERSNVKTGISKVIF